jgi:hypothetical protein
MTKFESLKKLCGKVAKSKSSCAEAKVRKLLKACGAWSEENENGTHLFDTAPHGEQTVLEIDQQTDPARRELPGNRLFRIRDTDGNFIIMTGEEIFSLAEKFNHWAINTPHKHDFEQPAKGSP